MTNKLDNTLFSIFEAIDKNDIESLNTLVLSNVVKHNDSIKDQSFLYACKKGKVESGRVLLNNAHPNVRFADGQTASMLLCQNSDGNEQHINLLKDIISKGCNVDLVDYCGKNVLHWAVLSEAFWSIRTLIENRCNINSADIVGYTPLMYATKIENASIVGLLLHNGADVQKHSKQHGTSLHIAARFNCPEALGKLVKFCGSWINLSLVDCRNQTPIDLAVIKQHVKCIDILVSACNKSVNRRPNLPPFRTPLEEACFRNNIEIVELLLENGLADPNYPLDYSFQYDNRSNKSQAKLIAPLMLAVSNRNLEMVQLLLKHGADVNVKCPKAPGHDTITSPISLAIELNETKLVEILSKQKSNQITVITDDIKQDDLEDIKESITNQYFEITHELISNFIRQNPNESIESITEDICKLKSQNDLPIVLLLFLSDTLTDPVKSVISILSINILQKELLNDALIELVTENQSGPIMRRYRNCIINFMGYLQDEQLIDTNLTSVNECVVVKFVVNHLYQYFMTNSSKELSNFTAEMSIIEKIFSKHIIKQVLHSTKTLKAILCNHSVHHLKLLLKYQFEEKLAFWDNPLCKQKFDVCEFALLFDNLKAVLLLHIYCNLSLKSLDECFRLPIIPGIMSEDVDYRITPVIIRILKKLSKTVKPLRVICRYTIIQSYGLHDIDSITNQLPQTLSDYIENHMTRVSRFGSKMFTDSEYGGDCEIDFGLLSEIINLDFSDCE